MSIEKNVTLLIDFGSTYTKVRAVDIDRSELLGMAQAPSTVASDMTDGLNAACQQLFADTGLTENQIQQKLASSSAAGGLAIAVIGLVPGLTTEAAKKAAFGAGGKVIKAYSNKLTRSDIDELVSSQPDLILLAGGTDGGNEKVILHNSQRLAESAITTPILYAGNRTAADDAQTIFSENNKSMLLADNIMPALNELSLASVHRAIRELFIKNIVHGKGLDKAQAMVGDIIMPTPLAVLKGAELLAQGTKNEPGLGDLLLVDVGGATTDVNSLANWTSGRSDILQKGLPEDYATRTVEGDLGLRYNATHILEQLGFDGLRASLKPIQDDAGIDLISDQTIQERVEQISQQAALNPESTIEHLIDTGIAFHAVQQAVKRHAGYLQAHHTADGTTYFQFGKDLTEIKTVIATGGIFKYGRYPKAILQATLFEENNPLSLRPKAPSFLRDDNYLLFATGLLADQAPDAALRICKQYLKRL